MTTALVTQSLDKLGQNTVFQFDGYEPLQAYGPDRVAFSRLRSEFESHGETIATIDTLNIEDIDTCIFIDMDYDYLDQLLSQPDTPSLVYVMREPPSVMPENAVSHLVNFAPIFDAVLTWNDSLADVHDFIGYNIPQFLENDDSQPPDFESRSLLANITSRKYSSHPDELYSEREKIIRFYDKNHPGKFNLYGRYWNQSIRPADIFYHKKFSYDKFETYQGLADSKIETYRKHRFVLCFENMTGIDGYLTEKIFDCFRAGAVPIYWGADNISDYLPEETFIDYREFGSPERLHEHISSLGKTDFQRHVDAARRFLQRFPSELSPKQYARTVYGATRAAQHRERREVPVDLRRSIKKRGSEKRFVRESDEMALPEYFGRIGKQIRGQPTSFWDDSATIIESIWQRYG